MADERPEGHEQDRDQLQAHAPLHQTIAATPIFETVDRVVAHRKNTRHQDAESRQAAQYHKNEQYVGKGHRKSPVSMGARGAHDDERDLVP